MGMEKKRNLIQIKSKYSVRSQTIAKKLQITFPADEKFGVGAPKSAKTREVGRSLTKKFDQKPKKVPFFVDVSDLNGHLFFLSI